MHWLVMLWGLLRRWVWFLSGSRHQKRCPRKRTARSQYNDPWNRRLTQWLQRALQRFHSTALPALGRHVRVEETPIRRGKRKPDWVKHKILYLKALMPEISCRTLADVFNRRYAAQGMRVGKTFVSDVIRDRQYEIQVLRRNLKHRRPKPIAHNVVWGMDLTGKHDTERQVHSILGILEHRARAVLLIAALPEKTTLALLRCLLDAIERYGKPTILRTDNEAVFTSWLFRFVVWGLGIRHQRIEPHCPWQNGKIERFFGTLKQKLDKWEITCREELNGALVQFRFWYNHVRPHQHLDGRTPAEVWQGVDVYTRPPKKEYWFEAWEGLLQGIYLKH